MKNSQSLPFSSNEFLEAQTTEDQSKSTRVVGVVVIVAVVILSLLYYYCFIIFIL